MDPSTLQCAGTVAVAAFQRGGLKVTADTGSPIAVFGMLVPAFATVQSASVILLSKPTTTS
jgi:hypothetical protein